MLLRLLILISVLLVQTMYANAEVQVDKPITRNVTRTVSSNQNEKIITIIYMGNINSSGINKLFDIIDQAKRVYTITGLNIIISSTGGDTAAGIAAYNYLTSLPKSIKIHTHNLASVSSAAVFLYCAGSERSSAPIAQFFIHLGTTDFTVKATSTDWYRGTAEWMKKYDDMSEEVLAACTKRPLDEMVSAHRRGITLTPMEAKKFGLVHAIGATPITDDAAFVSSE